MCIETFWVQKIARRLKHCCLFVVVDTKTCTEIRKVHGGMWVRLRAAEWWQHSTRLGQSHLDTNHYSCSLCTVAVSGPVLHVGFAIVKTAQGIECTSADSQRMHAAHGVWDMLALPTGGYHHFTFMEDYGILARPKGH